MTRRLSLPTPLSPILIGVAMLLAGGCGMPSSDTVLPEETPVVLISVDTLRSDRLPMYGYHEVDTPALDRLRRDSILFEHAFSPISLTLPAHSTMLTGLLPAEHGVRDNSGYVLEADDLPWLPRVLKDAGYRTGAAVSSLVLRGTTGFATDFELYDDRILQAHWPGSVQRTGDVTLEASRSWLREVAGEPFFFFFHIYEPHRPLEPPEPFASRYPSAYDGEVASADQIVGELLDLLRELEVYDRALILFVSDHGEGLGDHGLDEHGLFLYREQIQVPMLLKLPESALAATSVARPTQLADITPTVLGLLGLEIPEGLDGISLLTPPGEVGERPIYGETFYPRLNLGWSELASVIVWPYHYIEGPDPELYDLGKDPAEVQNILRQDRRAYARLRDALERYDHRFQPPGATDPKVRDRLAALGYLGHTSGATVGPRADPKSKLDVLKRMGDAFSHLRGGDFPGAEKRYRQIVQEEPQISDAWRYLGHSLFRQGRAEEALEAYRHFFELTSGSPQAAMNMAEALLSLQRLDEAEERARFALEALPAEAQRLLGLVALSRKDLDSAERHARQALELDEANLLPRITLARVAVERGQPERALELTDEVISRAPADLAKEYIRGLYVTRGEALAQEGRVQEAESAFRREIELFPTDFAAYTRLALLFALTDRADASARVLGRMMEVNPEPRAYAEAARTIRVLGDSRAAERLLERARRRWPSSPILQEPAS